MQQTHKYYDGIPQWIRNLSKEDLDKLIEEEEKDLLNLTYTRNRQLAKKGRLSRPLVNSSLVMRTQGLFWLSERVDASFLYL